MHISHFLILIIVISVIIYLLIMGISNIAYVEHHFYKKLVNTGTDVILFHGELLNISKHTPTEILKLIYIITWTMDTWYNF